MKNIVIIQARMSSTRLPGKVLKNLNGKPLIEWIVSAAKKIDLAHQVIVATSNDSSSQKIVDYCAANHIECYQGDENDVLNRFYEAAKKYSADNIVRLTADCPLIDPNVCSQILLKLIECELDYVSNVAPPTWPDGYDCEAFTMKALTTAHQHAKSKSDREHVTPYIRNHAYQFKTANVYSSIPGLNEHRWTVDSPEDLQFLETLVEKSNGQTSLGALLQTLKNHPNVRQPNLQRNHSFEAQVVNHTDPIENFETSHVLLQRSLKHIPLGSQTFSKSHIQFPKNTSPHFLTHGNGSHVWDVDGNEYIDLVNALLPNVLGYSDPDVNFAVQEQLQKGVSMSLATTLEMELAEMLSTLIPSAESVRYGKNGTDATSASIRLARAYTKRDKVIVSGYHGWQDWYIGTTTRNLGIPKAVCDLSTSVPYNNLDAIEQLLKTEEYAAMIMEPCNVTAPQDSYLQNIKNLCEKFGSLLIFDETITGFRFSLGGAQSYFNVTPHLSCFGKGMANGFPLSAIVGRKDIMHEMENIFFSGTFGGEALSLAASISTIKKLQKTKAIDHLWNIGEELFSEATGLIKKNGLQDVIALNGFAPWKILAFKDAKTASAFEVKTYFLQEMIRAGILINGSHNVCYSFGQNEKAKTIQAYTSTLSSLAECLNQGQLQKKLKSPPIQPVFKVR